MEYTDEDIAELADLFTNGPETETDDCVAVKVVPSSRATRNLCSVKTEPSADDEPQAFGVSHTMASTAVQQSIQTVEQADRNVISHIWQQPQNHAANIQGESVAFGSYHHENLPLPITSRIGGQRQVQSQPTLNRHSLPHLRNSASAGAHNGPMIQDPRIQNTSQQKWPVVFQGISQERQQTAPRDGLPPVSNSEQQSLISAAHQQRQYRNKLPKVVARHQLPVAALGELQQRKQTSGWSQPATTVANHTHQQQYMQNNGQSHPVPTVAHQVYMHRGNHSHQRQQLEHFQQQTPATQWNSAQGVVAHQWYTQQERHLNVNDHVHHRTITNEVGQHKHYSLQVKNMNPHQVAPNQWCPPPLPRPISNVAIPMNQQQHQQIYQQQLHIHRLSTILNGIHQPNGAQFNPSQRFRSPGMIELQQRHVNVHESFSHRPVARQLNQQRLSTPMAMHQPDTTQWSKGPIGSHGDVWLTKPTIHQRSQPTKCIARLVPYQTLVSEQHQEKRLATNESGKQQKVTVSQPSPPQSKPLCIKPSQPQGTPNPTYPNEYKQPVFALEDLRQYEPIYSGEAVVEEVTLTKEEAIALFDKPASKPVLVSEVDEKKLSSPDQGRTCETNQCESPMDCSIPTSKETVDDLKLENSAKIELDTTGSFKKRLNTHENPYDLTLKDLDIYQKSYEKDDFLTAELSSMQNGRSETQSPDAVTGPPTVSTAVDISNEGQHQYVHIKAVSCETTRKTESSNNTESSNKVQDNGSVDHDKTGAFPNRHEPTVVSQENQENQCSSMQKANLTKCKCGPTTHREKRILELWAQKLRYVLPTKKQVFDMSVYLQRKIQFVLVWLSKQSWALTQCTERKAARKSQKTQHQTEHRTVSPQANLIPTTVSTLNSGSICDDIIIPPKDSDSQSPEPISLQCEMRTSSCESDSSGSIETEHEKTSSIKLGNLVSKSRSEDTNCGSGIESDTLPGGELHDSDQSDVGKELCKSDGRSYKPNNLASEVLVQVSIEALENSKENHESENVAAKSLQSSKYEKKLLERLKQTACGKTLRQWMSDHPGNIHPTEEEIEELSTITETSPKIVRRFFAKERMMSHKKLWLQNVSADQN